jgi:hypothetical protein
MKTTIVSSLIWNAEGTTSWTENGLNHLLYPDKNGAHCKIHYINFLFSSIFITENFRVSYILNWISYRIKKGKAIPVTGCEGP